MSILDKLVARKFAPEPPRRLAMVSREVFVEYHEERRKLVTRRRGGELRASLDLLERSVAIALEVGESARGRWAIPVRENAQPR